MTTFVYFFGSGKAEGKAEMKNLLGGKGANQYRSPGPGRIHHVHGSLHLLLRQ
jgi:hypothetical protein